MIPAELAPISSANHRRIILLLTDGNLSLLLVEYKFSLWHHRFFFQKLLIIFVIIPEDTGKKHR